MYINAYQTSKIQVVCQANKSRQKLLFPKYQTENVLNTIEKKVPEIYVQRTLQEELKRKGERKYGTRKN